MLSPTCLRTVPAGLRPDNDGGSRFNATICRWSVRSVIFGNKKRQPHPDDRENEQYAEKEQQIKISDHIALPS
ncbi:hypothetical protein A6V36_36640 [Paraburkholderia ginsengiterrae]|uniref:Uncharacterized protein n=1 Tax=Paraburkholderia ginsengiterrae TaxID=1462993 RepID=A0ABX2UN02_9BURK|nr:hypothetical protein A6V36_36640 [Paraburkholderia ginsengiterrae]